MDNELLEKIKVCVAYDLIGRGKLRIFEDMSITEKNKFIKQVNRLYDTCIITNDQTYINERYYDIISGVPHPHEVSIEW